MGIYPTLDELKISTHALAWRATKAKQWWGDNHGYFYPRPRMEGDPHRLVVGSLQFVFLPTPSHGGRLYLRVPDIEGIGISTHALAWRATAGCSPAGWTAGHFYPRPRMEGDAYQEVGEWIAYISTHALAWRATARFQLCSSSKIRISTHALAWRATDGL